MIMAMDKATPHFGQHRFAVWLKTLAVAFGVMAVGYAVVKMNDDRASPLHAFAATAVGGADATSANPSIMRDERLPTTEQVSVSPSDKVDSSKNEPRECRPDQGIVNDCTFG
jgi:hypothetical protein